jgi:hypothetical protein
VDKQQQDSQQQQSGGGLWAAGIFFVALAFLFIVLGGYVQEWEWTGLTTPKHRTFWDWMKLLIVPAVIAAGGLWFNRQQQERQREDERRQQERGLEIESQRAQDEALQAYLDQMSQLLADEKRPLHRAQQGDSLSTVARARTLTVLSRLDGVRKGIVVQFLYESKLIVGDQPVLNLQGADLQRVVLEATRLSKVNLKGAILSYGSFTGVVLREALLTGAHLNNTDFVGVDLREAILRHVNLSQAVLRRWTTSYSNLVGSLVPELPERQPSEFWLLREMRLKSLGVVRLVPTMLSGADLSGADLRGADLRDVFGLTNELLQEQAFMLRGTTMPNGQKYEDWLKDRDKRQQDE